MPIILIAAIVFVMLKLAGLVAWSWWWVGWIPLWVGFWAAMTPPRRTD